MGYAEEEQQRMPKIPDLPEYEIFQDVSDKDLIEAYKKAKKEALQQKKKEEKEIKDKVIEENNPPHIPIH